MKTESINDIYKSKFKKIEKYYHHLLRDFNEDDIHFFRVEIKKLRAFLRLINLSQTLKQFKIPKSVKKFYHILGTLRNLQLNQQRITRLSKDLFIENPSAYLKCMHDREKSIKKKSLQFTEDISFKDFENKLIKESAVKLTLQNKNAFVQKAKIRLVQLLALPCFYDETLHDIRKLIKDLMYNYPFLDSATSMMLPPVLGSIKRMEVLTAVLGDYHDLCIAVYLLDSVNSNQFLGETEALDKLKTHLHLRKESMIGEVLKSLAPVRQQFESQIPAASCLSI